MKNKKFLAGILSAAMLLSMPTAVYAADTAVMTDESASAQQETEVSVEMIKESVQAKQNETAEGAVGIVPIDSVEEETIENTVNEAGYTGLKKENGAWVYYKDGVKDTDKTGLVKYNGGWFYVKNGQVDTSSVGFVEYDGGYFYVAKGQIVTSANGIVQDGGNWYFVSKGQFQNYTGLAEYDGAWFVLENGILDTSYNDLYYYDGSLFLVAAGQIKSDYSGLFQTPSGLWVYVANGQVCDYTGLVLYNGVWFYVIDGVLDTEYVGFAKYDGSVFYAVNGQLNMESYEMVAYQQGVTNRSVYANEIAAVVSYNNAYRSAAGVQALTLDEDLTLAACAQAQQMADANDLADYRANGKSWLSMLEELGIDYGVAGGQSGRGHVDAYEVCSDWASSSSIYENITDSEFTRTGVGVAVDSTGKLYWVQLYAD